MFTLCCLFLPPGATMSCAGPDIEYESGRGVRTSPLYTRLQNSGAIFGQIIGFEPALYFDSPSVLMGRVVSLTSC